jgi:hypothetical protein
MTVLTVGYGDVIPHTDGGRFITVLAGVLGLMLFALAFVWAMTFHSGGSRAEAKVTAHVYLLL